ncbi:FAD-binding oxidoreductase [Nocardia sp. NBC_01499]|uniref:FAD-binding oxidoreductase n=1 Tax=Nocardia sp. NBC_01499 TaxID=2903597 RepID=UPI003869D3D8
MLTDGGLSRATFLLGALGAGAAALVGSGLTLSGNAAAQPPLAGVDWEPLRRQLRGRVLLPWESEYLSAKLLPNTRFDSALPAAVIQVASVEDVQAAVTFAREHRLRVTARNGGHSYVGASAADGIVVLDLRQLNDVRYDSGQAKIGAGALTSTVYETLARSDQSLPAALCPGVGLTGLTLGGGIGVESRAYGLTCDRIVSAQVVLADGSVVETSATDRPELFWALRGGGARVGIVTSLTMSTIPAVTKDIVRMTFPGESAARVLAGWAQWLRTADRDTWGRVELNTDGGALTCRTWLVGADGAGKSAAAALVRSFGVEPLTSSNRRVGLLDRVIDLAGEGGMTPGRTAFAAGSDILEEISAEVADAIVGAIVERSRSGRPGNLHVSPLDGAVQDVSSDATAFPWRRHTAVVQWAEYKLTDYVSARNWIDRAHERVAGHSAGAYFNYAEPSGTGQRYFAGNLNRLREIRMSVDPDNRIYSVPDI